MRDFKKLRQGVMKSLPEIQNIKDLELRGKVVEAWALSLSKSSFNRIEEMKGSGGPDTPAMKLGSQSDHLRGVAKLAIAILDTLEEMFGSLNVDRDTLWAAGLCHDLGKPFEYDPENRKRWNMDYRISGKPSIRHPVYGVHIALTVGLPEEIAHVCGGHSREGEYIKRSLVNTLVYLGDLAFWNVLESHGSLEDSSDKS